MRRINLLWIFCLKVCFAATESYTAHEHSNQTPLLNFLAYSEKLNDAQGLNSHIEFNKLLEDLNDIDKRTIARNEVIEKIEEYCGIMDLDDRQKKDITEKIRLAPWQGIITFCITKLKENPAYISAYNLETSMLEYYNFYQDKFNEFLTEIQKTTIESHENILLKIATYCDQVKFISTAKQKLLKEIESAPLEGIVDFSTALLKKNLRRYIYTFENLKDELSNIVRKEYINASNKIFIILGNYLNKYDLTREQIVQLLNLKDQIIIKCLAEELYSQRIRDFVIEFTELYPKLLQENLSDQESLNEELKLRIARLLDSRVDLNLKDKIEYVALIKDQCLKYSFNGKKVHKLHERLKLNELDTGLENLEQFSEKFEENPLRKLVPNLAVMIKNGHDFLDESEKCSLLAGNNKLSQPPKKRQKLDDRKELGANKENIDNL